VSVLVGRSKLDELPELRLGLLEPLDPEVRDPERLADRRLLGLASLRLLERDGRLRSAPLPQVLLSLLEELIRFAHRAYLDVARSRPAEPASAIA
jgi:hypothetical protein